MRKLTNFYFSILLLILALSVNGFSQAKADDNQNWKDKNFEKTGIYGVATDDALEFLKSKGLKPAKITVAVIDGGVQVDHEDLIGNIWNNPKEQSGNGQDDDKNGYIDDLNGWDFIGGKDGKDVNYDTLEMVRIVVEGEKLFKDNPNNQKAMPEKYAEYLNAKKEFETKLSEDSEALANIKQYQQFFPVLLGALAQETGTNKLNKEYLTKLKLSNARLQPFVNSLIQSGESEGFTAQEYLAKLLDDLKEGFSYFDNSIKYKLNRNFDPRPTVGDNYADKTEKNYGNNEVEGPDANHGTHVAGIIGALRNNGKGANGVAGDVAQIMVLRTVPNGDERDKDVANSIRYAVDNGAKIINMSFGKDFSPDKQLVWEAIVYADQKGVLMFHAAGNDNENIDIKPNYPTNFKDGKSLSSNWITVGASTIDPKDLRANFSNYGKTRVDIFAPGKAIYSTVPKSKYENNNGTSMASPVAAGCAAVLWAYFPNLTATQVREILFKSVNRSDVEVGVGKQDEQTGKYKEYKKFSELSTTGGVIDLLKAVKMAYELTSK